MTRYVTQLVGAAWILWIVGWYAVAWWSAPKVAIHPSSSQAIYRVLELVGAALIIWDTPRWGTLFVGSFTTAATGLALVLIGLGWTVWARVHLGRNWSVDVSLKAGHTIIRSGPYSITRHPIYTGLLIAVFGTVLMKGALLAALGFVVIIAAVHFKSSQEETLLSGHFGEGYVAYQREVRKLIPFVW